VAYRQEDQGRYMLVAVPLGWLLVAMSTGAGRPAAHPAAAKHAA
jgi:hypothetical protein